MATYQRSTVVDAPLDDVWAFYSSVDGLVALTPSLLDMAVHDVVGPDGRSDPEVLAAGSRVHASIRPFGVGPRRHWTSTILDRSRDDGVARFRDEMVDGPFASWVHDHVFLSEDDGSTVVVDHVEYELPGGRLGHAASPFGVVGLEPMFRERHRRTRRLLEAPTGAVDADD